MHPVCNKTAKNVAKKFNLCPECKALCLWQIQHNTSLSTTHHIIKRGGGSIMLWICLSSAKTREFLRIKRNGMELSTGNILEENMVQFAFQLTLGDKFTFQQGNNLKLKVNYTVNWSCLPRQH